MFAHLLASVVLSLLAHCLFVIAAVPYMDSVTITDPISAPVLDAWIPPSTTFGDDVSLGSALSSVGDINGDGVDDLAIAMPYANDFVGVVVLLWGKLKFTDPYPAISELPDPTKGILLKGNPSSLLVGVSIVILFFNSLSSLTD